MQRLLAALLAGTVFGLGLGISGMVNPAKVLGFLDLFGAWDPTLALVMGGALLVTTPAFRVLSKLSRPVLAPQFYLPTRCELDQKLLLGAAIFGVGWGLAGLCPGPALADLATGKLDVLLFVVAMFVGFAAVDFGINRKAA